MGFVFLIVGLLMIVTGGRGTYAQFGSQIAGEFQGQNNFTYQLVALGAIGALGYIPALQTISRWALAFILLVILLGNKNNAGFFPQFQAALKAGPTAPQAVTSSGSSANVATATTPLAANTAAGTSSSTSQSVGDFLQRWNLPGASIFGTSTQ